MYFVYLYITRKFYCSSLFIFISENFFPSKKKKKITIPKFSQFTKYSEKIIFPENRIITKNNKLFDHPSETIKTVDPLQRIPSLKAKFTENSFSRKRREKNSLVNFSVKKHRAEKMLRTKPVVQLIRKHPPPLNDAFRRYTILHLLKLISTLEFTIERTGSIKITRRAFISFQV